MKSPGFQYIASGMLLQIIGRHRVEKYHVFEGKTIETQIRRQSCLLWKTCTAISQENLAKDMGLGYSLYRKNSGNTPACRPRNIISSYGLTKPKTF
jgi:hypothetical protein